jgi:hypothetical protein
MPLLNESELVKFLKNPRSNGIICFACNIMHAAVKMCMKMVNGINLLGNGNCFSEFEGPLTDILCSFPESKVTQEPVDPWSLPEKNSLYSLRIRNMHSG